MQKTSFSSRQFVLAVVVLAGLIGFGFGSSPQVQLEGARLSQTVEALRQKTVELERELDSIKSSMEAQRRESESRQRELEERLRRDREVLAGDQATLQQRVDGLNSRIRLALLEGELVRLEPVEDDLRGEGTVFRVRREAEDSR